MKKYGCAYEFTDKTARTFYFVSLGTCYDRTRPMYANRILIEDGKAIATDGKRLHIAVLPKQYKTVNGEKVETELIEPGDYQIIKASSKSVVLAKLTGDFITFCNYKKAIPNGIIEKSMHFIGFRKTHHLFYNEVSKLILFINNGINVKYLADLKDYTWKVEVLKGEDKNGRSGIPVTFTSAGLTAIIMPLNLVDN